MTIGHGYGLQTGGLRKLNYLNLGSGLDKKKSEGVITWYNVDSSASVSPDKVWKVGDEIAPFGDDVFDLVESHHSLEHFSNIIFAVEEMYRITRNGGVWKITVPFGYSWQDNIFHEKIGWHWNSWDKFTQRNRPYYSKVKLELIDVKGTADGWLKYLPFKRKLSSLMNNIYREITYELRVIK